MNNWLKNFFGSREEDDNDDEEEIIDACWEYGQNRDEMRNATTVWAKLKSDNDVYFDPPYDGGSSLYLVIKKSPKNGLSAFFLISKGQFLLSVDERYASVKFDNGRIKKILLVEPASGSTNTAFIKHSLYFIDLVKKSKTMFVEMDFYSHGVEQFQFQTADLEWDGVFNDLKRKPKKKIRNETGLAAIRQTIVRFIKLTVYVFLGFILLSFGITFIALHSGNSDSKETPVPAATNTSATPPPASHTPKITPPEQPAAPLPVVAEVAASAPQAAPQPAIPPAPVGKRRWEPQDACQYLSHTLPTRRYNDAVCDGIYICASEYQDIGTRTSDRMANNLSYYVIGTQNHARKLKLLLNYNNPKQAASGTTALITAAKELAIAATGKSLPKTIESKLKTGKAGETTIDGIRHAVYRQNWPRGNGYEVRYVLSNANDKPIIRNEPTGANTDISDYPDADKDIIPTADAAAENKETATAVNSKWRYSEDTDQIRNTKSYRAMLFSENSVDFDFPYNGGSILGMALRKSAKYGDDIFFTISKGQFSCGYDGCHAIIKFDDGKPQKISLVEAADGDMTTLFLSGKAGNLAAKIKKSKTMMIELSFFQEGSRQFLFQTEGLQWKHF